MGGSLLFSRFATGNTELEAVKQHPFQSAAALWRQKQLQLNHPATLALCRLALAVASDQTFLLSPPPCSFPATCCHFQLSAAIYIYILFNLSLILPTFFEGKMKLDFFQARFSKEASFMWSARPVTFFTSSCTIFQQRVSVGRVRCIRTRLLVGSLRQHPSTSIASPPAALFALPHGPTG